MLHTVVMATQIHSKPNDAAHKPHMTISLHAVGCPPQRCDATAFEGPGDPYDSIRIDHVTLFLDRQNTKRLLVVLADLTGAQIDWKNEASA